MEIPVQLCKLLSISTKDNWFADICARWRWNVHLVHEVNACVCESLTLFVYSSTMSGRRIREAVKQVRLTCGITFQLKDINSHLVESCFCNHGHTHTHTYILYVLCSTYYIGII